MEKKDTSSNLIPMPALTEEEQRELARKGGIASGLARRERKKARELAQMMAECIMMERGEPVVNPLTGEPMTLMQATIYKQFEKAYTMADTAALKLLLELMGELKEPTIQVNTAIVQRSPEEAYAAAYGIEREEVEA